MSEFANDIQSSIFSLLPMNKKRGNTGWWQYDCPVCHLVGPHRRDTRGRGQATFNKSGIFLFCHNCHFKTGWTPGNMFGQKLSMYLEALGAKNEDIQKLQLVAMQIQDTEDVQQLIINPDLKPRRLPKGAKPFSEWLKLENPPAKFIQALEYLNNRNPRLLELVDFYWTDETIGRQDGRVIIPLSYRGDVLGYSARWFDGDLLGRPKYINDIPPGLMYNIDILDDPWRKYIVLVEGGLDAAIIDGIGIMKNRVTEQQLRWLSSTDKKIIVLPDRDKSGKMLVDQAIEYSWGVSFPDWDGAKDAEEASRKYGRLFVIERILASAITEETMIKIQHSNWMNN